MSLKKKLDKIILLFFALITYDVLSIPQPIYPPRLVNDFAGILNESQKATLEKVLVDYNDSTSTQILVITVSSLEGMDANLYAYKIGESWGVGQKGKNNGIVFLIKPKIKDSVGQVAISVGYGLEHVVTDALSKRIIEQVIIPYFKENDYYGGILAGTKAIMLASRGQYKADPKGNPDFEGTPVFALIILLFFFLTFIFSVIRSRRSHYHISSKGENDIFFWLFMGSIFRHSGGSKGNDWKNFSSGSGSFGGFRGFGGGSFGGGGASGSW